MFHKKWPLLVVDDAPDVLQITRLLLRRTTVLGLPLEVHTAASAQEAMDWVEQHPRLAKAVPVALLDVVMETDDAGLRLCGHLREVGLHACHLVVRTGQPGLAPAREVIDRHDVDGYLSKVESTEIRLYSILRAGIEQHLLSRWTTTALHWLTDGEAALDEALAEDEPGTLFEPRLGLFLDGAPRVIRGAEPAELLAVRDGHDGWRRVARGRAELVFRPTFPLPRRLDAVLERWVSACAATRPAGLGSDPSARPAAVLG